MNVKLLFFPLALAAWGCDFRPGGSSFTEVKQPDVGDVKVRLSIASDTIAIDQVKLFTFILDGSDIQSSNTFVIFRKDTLVRSSLRSADFTVSTGLLGPGFYSLQLLSVFTKTTKSLSSVLGVESFYTVRNYTIYADTGPLQPIQIIGITTVNGRPKVKWPKYIGTNFQNYTVYKRCYATPSSTSFTSCYFISFAEIGKTSFVDDLYIPGTKVDYRVTITAKGSEATGNPVIYLN